MADEAERTYLELSEEQGSAHKFYEVVVKGCELTIRYGRIGTDGQTSTQTFPTPEAARAEAAKKIKQKRSKGYEPAVMGVRQKRSITRRQIVSQPSQAHRAPLLWRFQSGAPALGIFIDAEHCWVGNQAGSIFVLDHQAQLLNQYRLPDGVKCIVADGPWLYAGCDDGNVYDLTGKLPRAVYQVSENVDIFWLDIHNALLGVSDANGTLIIANSEDEALWQQQSGGTSGWMVRCDNNCVYHGHSHGVTAYTGWIEPGVKWEFATEGSVLFGWQERETVYAGTGSGHKVYALRKADGQLEQIYQCDAPVFSCAAAEDGKYVFAGDNYSSIYCFDKAGQRLWKLATGCGSAFSMQYFNERLYIVTTDGSLACIDASEAAIQAAQTGQVPAYEDIKAPQAIAVAQPTALEMVSDAAGRVIVQCVRIEGKLRIRVMTEGYRPDWNVQFPRDLREEGALYVVDEVREAAGGGFYRAYGNISRLREDYED